MATPKRNSKGQFVSSKRKTSKKKTTKRKGAKKRKKK